MAVGEENLTMWKKKVYLGHEEHIKIREFGTIVRNLGISSKYSEQPLKGFKQKSDVIWFMFLFFVFVFFLNHWLLEWKIV